MILINKKYFGYSCFLLLLLACSPNFSYKFKSFIFDGVPDPSKPKEELKITYSETDSVATILDSASIAAVTPVKIEGSQHPPFIKRECFECHDKGSFGKTKIEQPTLCYQCHENITDSYQTLHAPLNMGACTECHSPHNSKFEKLLMTEAQDVCFYCHKENDVLNSAIHNTIEEQSCTTCHNPHGGENNFVLQKDACFNCHENVIGNNKYIHGPVDAGKCNVCHESHSSQSKSLLILQDNALCFNCHELKTIKEKDYHVYKDNTKCISCHDPHSSNQNHLITIIK